MNIDDIGLKCVGGRSHKRHWMTNQFELHHRSLCEAKEADEEETRNRTTQRRVQPGSTTKTNQTINNGISFARFTNILSFELLKGGFDVIAVSQNANYACRLIGLGKLNPEIFFYQTLKPKL